MQGSEKDEYRGVWDKLVLIGFGSQGKAWASNLRDSGRTIEVFLRSPNSLKDHLKARGFALAHDLSHYPALLLLIPDDQHLGFLKTHSHSIPSGTSIIYAHGASMMENDFAQIYPQFNHLLLAPKAIASEVRFQYENKGKLGAVYSVQSTIENIDIDLEVELLALAQDLGITAGPFRTSFKDEACADLFSEQSLLCGLIPHAAKISFEMLLKRGISPELAYMECWLEVKLIADAMVKKGPAELFNLISPHALKGSHLAQQRFFDKAYHEILERLLSDIENGSFFKAANEIDSNELRSQYRKLWSNSELQKIHDKLKEVLVP